MPSHEGQVKKQIGGNHQRQIDNRDHVDVGPGEAIGRDAGGPDQESHRVLATSTGMLSVIVALYIARMVPRAAIAYRASRRAIRVSHTGYEAAIFPATSA